MHKDTINAIAVLLSLFTEEEKEGLKITLGTREITLQDQFIGRWGDSEPRYTGDKFLYKAAHIISGNKLLFIRAIEFNKPEFQRQFAQLISNPDNFIRQRSTNTVENDAFKTLSISQTLTRAQTRGTSKSRGGTAESGHEYNKIDKVWDEEDNEYLAHQAQNQRLSANLQIDASKPGLAGVTIALQQNEVQENAQFAQITPNSTVEQHEPALQSVTTNQSRSKSISDNQGNNLGLTNASKDKNISTVVKDSN